MYREKSQIVHVFWLKGRTVLAHNKKNLYQVVSCLCTLNLKQFVMHAFAIFLGDTEIILKMSRSISQQDIVFLIKICTFKFKFGPLILKAIKLDTY